LMVYIFHPSQQKKIKSVSNFFWPMKKQLEKDFAHQIHSNLILLIWPKTIKEVMDDSQHFDDWVIMLAFKNYTDYF
jgi:hypothetical protein